MSSKSRNVQIDTDGYIIQTKALSWLENEVQDIHLRRSITRYLDKWIQLLVKASFCPDEDYGHESFLMMYREKSKKMWEVMPYQIACNIDSHINACRRQIFCG